MLNLPGAASVLREARLKYRGQAHSWCLLQQEETWFGSVCDGLAWPQSFVAQKKMCLTGCLKSGKAWERMGLETGGVFAQRE